MATKDKGFKNIGREHAAKTRVSQGPTPTDKTGHGTALPRLFLLPLRRLSCRRSLLLPTVTLQSDLYEQQHLETFSLWRYKLF